MIAPFAFSHCSDDAAADAQSSGYLAVGKFAAIEFPANFHDQCSREHRSFLVVSVWKNWNQSPSTLTRRRGPEASPSCHAASWSIQKSPCSGCTS
jgi:hypothetical protein